MQASGRVGHTPDPNTPDDIFTSSKELEPDDWELTTKDGGATPANGNVLDIYRTLDHPLGGDAFLYLAFTREASNGTVDVTFELNQDRRLWKNSQERDWAISANHAAWPPADLQQREQRPVSPRYPEDYVGLKPGYIKPADLAWYASHVHTADGLNQPYQ